MQERELMIPPEDRVIMIASGFYEIVIPAEQRIIYVEGHMPFSQQHTAGNIIKWQINYERWLNKAASITNGSVTSSSATCYPNGVTVQGNNIIFFLNGGVVNETFTLTVTMNDNIGNQKNDAINFTVVPP